MTDWTPMPPATTDWARLAAEVDAEAVAEAARTDPTIVKIAGYSPSGLGQLDTRCATAVTEFALRFENDMQQAKAVRHEREEVLNHANSDCAERREQYAAADQAVRHMEQHPSETPGDGRPSRMAIEEESRRKRLARLAPGFAALALLSLIEIAIYFEVFEVIGDTPWATVMLAIGAVSILVILPHVYGWYFRRCQENGRVNWDGRDSRGLRWYLQPSMVTLPPLVWFVLAGSAAYVRADQLTAQSAGQEAASSSFIELPPFEEIPFFPALALIGGLMFFTAMFAVFLGWRTGNPNDKTLRELRRTRDAAKAAFERAEAARSKANQEYSAVHQYVEGAENRLRLEIQTICNGFADLEDRYVSRFLLEVAKDDADVPAYGPLILEHHRASASHRDRCGSREGVIR